MSARPLAKRSSVARPALLGFAVFTLVLGAARAARAEEPAAGELTDAAFDAALAEAYGAKPDGKGFIPAVQKAAPRFRLLDAATEPGKGEWTVVTLNARGKRIDGVRFRVPEDERRD